MYDKQCYGGMPFLAAVNDKSRRFSSCHPAGITLDAVGVSTVATNTGKQSAGVDLERRCRLCRGPPAVAGVSERAVIQ